MHPQNIILPVKYINEWCFIFQVFHNNRSFAKSIVYAKLPCLQHVPHAVLLLFIAGENPDLRNAGGQKMLQHRGPEGPGPSRNHQCFSSKGICNVHHTISLSNCKNISSNIKNTDGTVIITVSAISSSPAQTAPRRLSRGHCESHRRTQTARGSSPAEPVQSAWNTPPQVPRSSTAVKKTHGNKQNDIQKNLHPERLHPVGPERNQLIGHLRPRPSVQHRNHQDQEQIPRQQPGVPLPCPDPDQNRDPDGKQIIKQRNVRNT